MGCCASTNKPSAAKKNTHISTSKTAAKHSSMSKSPPPTNPLPEEETVKEVLSETPSSIPKQPPPAILRVHDKVQSPFIKAAPLLQDFSRNAHDWEHKNGAVYKKPFAEFGADDLSDVSEICSTLSESVSASTSVTEKRENRDELHELRQRSPARFKNRSFSGEMNREKTVGRSPGRRSEPSPNRARIVNGSGYGRRRDGGESSGRRSRSPVMRSELGPSKSGVGSCRTQSARKTGKSPGRVGSGMGERTRKVDGGKVSGDSKWPPPTSNESLENPLVSLECFIFL